jgi:hypothetical protein
MIYKVYDSLGNLMRKFSTYQAASLYKMTFGNIYWSIKYLEITNKELGFI